MEAASSFRGMLKSHPVHIQTANLCSSSATSPCTCCIVGGGRAGAAQVERPGELQEAVGHERLSSNVSGILARLEGELDHVDSKIGESMHVLDLDNDGLVRPDPPPPGTGLASFAAALRPQPPFADASFC